MRRLLLFILICSIHFSFGHATDNETIARTGQIIKNAEHGTLSATVNLGTVPSSSDLDLRLELTNLSGEGIRFERVATGCNCTKVTPQKGTCQPGHKLTVKVSMNAPLRPSQVQGAGLLMFMDSDDGTVFEVRMRFDFQNHAGFKDSLVVAEWPDGNTSVKVHVPVVIGDNVGNKDIEVSLDGIEGALDWSLHERRWLKATVIPKSQQGRDLHGELELLNLLTSETSRCKLTISRSSLVKVFPHVLRMSKKEDGSYETQFFSRVNEKDGMTPSAVQVTAKCGKKQITCRSFGEDTLRRHRLVISSELAETLLAEGSRMSNVSLHYQIVFAKEEKGPGISSSYQLNVPILFRDFQ